MHISSEPLCSDPCARLKIQILMHSISSGCPKIVRHCDPIPLLINTFGIHLEPGCKSHKQVVHYRIAKNVQKQATVLLYFQTNFINCPGRDFLQSDQREALTDNIYAFFSLKKTKRKALTDMHFFSLICILLIRHVICYSSKHTTG